MAGIVSDELARVRVQIDACEKQLEGLPQGDPERVPLQNRLATLEQEKLLLLQQAHGMHAQRLSPAGLLSHRLPPAMRDLKVIQASSVVRHDLLPTRLTEWTHVQPTEPNSSCLLATIQEHQQDADLVYPGNFQLEPPRDTAPAALNSEADVVCALSDNIIHRVVPLAQAVNGADSARWQAHSPTWLIEEATREYIAQHGPIQGEASVPLLRSSRARPVKQRLGKGADEATSSTKRTTSTRLKTDFALEVEAGEAADLHLPGVSSGEAADPEPPLAKRRKIVCVGEVKAGLTEGPQETPLELLEAFNSPDHTYHNVASAVIAQVFTYMQLWNLQYSFITSWFATWLVHCPAQERTVLYISPPVKAADTNPTPQASVAWLQKQALDKRHELVDPYRPAPATTPLLHGDGDGAAMSADHGDHDSSPDAGAQRDSKDSSYQPDSRGEGSKTHTNDSQSRRTLSQVEPVAVPGSTALLTRICIGDAGSVVHARYQGAPAVIKLFNPGKSAPFCREVQAYQRLQQYQGTLLPRLLGSGYLVPGVLFVALSVVKGDTLASLGGSTYQRAAAAALRTLTTLQSVDGFLHGDAHLSNIMLVLDDKADDTSATCVFLDLGRARFSVSLEKQQEEREELRRRLRA